MTAIEESLYVVETKNLLRFLNTLGVAVDNTNYLFWMIDDVVEDQDMKQYALSRLFTDDSDKID